MRQALKADVAASRSAPRRPSLLASLMGQKVIVFSVGLAVLVLFAAIVIALYPVLRRAIPNRKRRRQNDETLAEGAPESPEQKIVAQLLASEALEEGPSLAADAEMYEYLSVVEGASDQPQPLTELFSVEENLSSEDGQSSGSEDKLSVEGEASEEGQDAESLMRMFIHMDELVADEDIDIQDVAGSQDILSSLFKSKDGEEGEGGIEGIFGGLGALDYHIEALIEALGDEL